MTLFTDGIISNPGRNLLDDVVTGQFDAAAAASQDQWIHSGIGAALRNLELGIAEHGPVTSPGAPAYGIPPTNTPDSPMLSAEEARRRVEESGLDIKIEDDGVREGVLDILLERKREERKRQFILQQAPTSTMPIQLLAGFATSLADPVGVAAAFIPVVGQARYAAMLGNASTRAARFGVRARVGALQGAVGAAAIEPLILHAASQDQADYGIADSLLNIAFGTVLGGGLHATGGLVSDMRRGSLLRDISNAAGTGESATLNIEAPAQRSAMDDLIARADEDPMTALRSSMDKAIAADRENIRNAALIQAREELVPTIRAELEDIATGRLPNVGTLRTEQGALQRSLTELDDTFRPMAKEFQAQRMTRKQAERAARDAIAEERQRLNARLAEIDDALDTNRQGELARADLARLDRGELPERYAGPVMDRVEQITGGFELSQAARAVAEAAPWQVRESALRSAVAQAASGRPVDVEAIFELNNPATRPQALERIAKPVRPEPDPEGAAMSRRADQTAQQSTADELTTMEQTLNDDLALANEMADQAGVDIQPLLRDADVLVRDADTFAAAFRAASVCQLRN